ncbi:MAG: aminopeptidase [Pseudomonadota bacterium]
MLTERQMDRYAEVLLWALKKARKGRYRKNDIILIRYDPAAERLAEILYPKILERGMNPVPRTALTFRMERHFFEKANPKHLVFQTPGEEDLYENLNGGIYLRAPESLTHLSRINPKKIGKATLSKKPLRDILDKRDEKGLFGWTLCILPTPELAKRAGLSLKQYDTQLIKACYLNKEDPVKEWNIIYRDAIAIKKWINSLEVKAYHMESEKVDLKIIPGKKRKWVGISGHNIPSFEIFLSPDCRETEGIYYADQPSYRSGNYVEGARIEFRKGKAVKVGAHKGGDFINKQLTIDGGASRVGEFSLTDRRFSKINKFMANTLFDENYGGRYGNCHVALGSSYSDTYDGDPAKLTKKMKKDLGFNDSALHWDLVNTEKKTVTAYLTSGKKMVIYENGMFRY